MTLGNGLVETAHYNTRLQPDLHELKQGTTSLWKLETAYTSGGAAECG